MPEVSDAVEFDAPYKESDEHVPDPTDAYGTLDTSATAGSAHGKVEAVTPIFEVAKAQDAITAAKALDPDDDSVDASLVVLPQGMVIAEDGAQEARDRVTAVGEKAAAEPVQVGGPNPFQKAAAEKTGEEGAAAAEAEQENQGAGTTGGGPDVSRQTGGDGAASSTKTQTAAKTGDKGKDGDKA